MSMNSYNLSEKELSLVTYFGYQDLLEHVPILTIYRMCLEKAFLNNDNSKYAESLRQVIKAINSCKVYRMTPAFDNLIQID